MRSAEEICDRRSDTRRQRVVTETMPGIGWATMLLHAAGFTVDTSCVVTGFVPKQRT